MSSIDASLVNVGVTTISVTMVLAGWLATSKIVSAISSGWHILSIPALSGLIGLFSKIGVTTSPGLIEQALTKVSCSSSFRNSVKLLTPSLAAL